MATVYTDALYSSTNLGVPQTSFFTLSGTDNVLVLKTPGTFNGVNVVGVAYNEVDWVAASLAAAPINITVSSFSSGVSAGDSTTLSSTVSSGTGLPFSLILADRTYITLSYSGTTGTLSADLSAKTTDVSDPNSRRLFMLGFI